jgi:hypothetical protein
MERRRRNLLRQCLEHQLRSDRNCRFERTIDRTSVGKETMDALCRVPLRLLGFQFEDDVDAPDHEHAVIQLDFAYRFRHQPLM